MQPAFFFAVLWNKMDLNLENYSLQDLLALFKLPIDFDEADLKRAKRTVLMTHPDKSKLDGEYFLFFTQAYKIVHYVYQVRHNGKVEPLEIDDDGRKKAAAERFLKTPHFHKQFNELFEKVYIRTEEESEGYGEWLKSSDDLDESYERRKSAARALVPVAPEVDPLPISLKVGVLGNQGGNYASLKHVYTTGSVVGVSDSEDLPAARTAEQLKQERGRPINPYSKEEAQRILAEAAAKEGTDDSHRAFDLMRRSLAQEERTKNDFWGHLLRLN